MTDEFFSNTFHLCSAGWTVPFLFWKRKDLIAGRHIFKEFCVCPSCFPFMLWNSDIIRKFRFPCRIRFLFGFIKKIQLTFDILPLFTGSAKKLLREIIPICRRGFLFPVGLLPMFFVKTGSVLSVQQSSYSVD